MERPPKAAVGAAGRGAPLNRPSERDPAAETTEAEATRFRRRRRRGEPEPPGMFLLMYRGEALEDFTGLDCRFVNFKKGDPVYVCSKFGRRSPEVWAGNETAITSTKSQESATADLGDDLFHWTPHKTIEPEYSDKREDLPITSSFFKEQQSLQRFQKCLNVHELESSLQEMSAKLQLARQESLPYDVEKVFRASASEGLDGAMEGSITTEDPPVDGDTDKKLEMVAEEPANVTLLEHTAKLLFYTVDSVPATVSSIPATPGDLELLGPLVLYAAFIAKLLEVTVLIPREGSHLWQAASFCIA
ncbi:Transport and Golgi organization protein 1-like protein [Plecturocebus cupreus]